MMTVFLVGCTGGGFTIYNKDKILFSEIQKSEYCENKINSIPKDNPTILKNFLSTPYTLSEGYLEINSRTYNVMPFAISEGGYSSGEYYKIFDYGILFRTGDYIDLTSGQIHKIFGYYQNHENTLFLSSTSKDKQIIVYADRTVYNFDDEYNREINIIIFTKDRIINRLFKYVYTGSKGDHPRSNKFEEGFWKDDVFYFKFKDKFYSITFNNVSFQKEDIFDNSYKYEFPNRDFSSKSYIELLNSCQNISIHPGDKERCILVTALRNKDESVCTKLTGQIAKRECIHAFAIMNSDPARCEKMDFGNLTCKINSLREKARSDPSTCEQFEGSVKNSCYKDSAVFNNDVTLCKDNSCYVAIAILKNDSSICSLITPDYYGYISYFGLCFEELGKLNKDIKMCENIPHASNESQFYYSRCKNEVNTNLDTCT